MRSRVQAGDRAAEHRPAHPPAPVAVASQAAHILTMQRTAGNAATTRALSALRHRGPVAVQRQRSVQREITLETEQELPRARIEPDAKSPNRLTVRYGAEVVAVISVGGPGATVDGISIRDRTGARNQGRKIDAIDLDILHPPGWTVTVEPARSALARTKKTVGVGDISITKTERKPPFGRDELQLWPGAQPLGPMRQRREQTKSEKAADKQWRADQRAKDIEDGRKVAELRKEYARLNGATDIADKYLMDLYGLGLIVQTLTKLPEPTHYNDIRRELFLALTALDNRAPGRAKVHLQRADKALWAANAQVTGAVQKGIANIDTAMRVTQKVGAISTFVGETIARMIPGPWGKALVILAEMLKPAPKTMDEAADRMMGALHTGQAWGQQRPPGKGGSGTEGTTVPKTTVPKTTVPKSTVTKTTVPKTTREDSTRVAGGAGGGTSSTSGTTSTAPTVKPSSGSTQTPPVKTSGSTQSQTPPVKTSGSTQSQTPPVKTSGSTQTQTQLPGGKQSAGKGPNTPATVPKVAGKDDQFVANQAARVANQKSPTLETLSGYTEVKKLGGGTSGGGINTKHILADRSGKHWLFKPANKESGMLYGPALGIKAGDRWRRAAAAAAIADKLGIDTPGVRLVSWNGQKGSLQEWRPGYQSGNELKAANRARFDEFWGSQQRKDLDAMDYVIAQQDRHMGNVMLKDRGKGKGFDMMAIDQDAAFPTSKRRFDPGNDPQHDRRHYQRPLAGTMSKSMADKVRALDANWPEAELRQWLTKPEVDGARARLKEVVGQLDSGQIAVVR